jgi:hypothetical protein
VAAVGVGGGASLPADHRGVHAGAQQEQGRAPQAPMHRVLCTAIFAFFALLFSPESPNGFSKMSNMRLAVGLVSALAVFGAHGLPSEDAVAASEVSLVQEGAAGTNVAQCWRLKSMVRSNGLRDGCAPHSLRSAQCEGACHALTSPSL